LLGTKLSTGTNLSYSIAQSDQFHSSDTWFQVGGHQSRSGNPEEITQFPYR